MQSSLRDVEINWRTSFCFKCVALKDIACGEVFTEENVTTKRPGTGISPMRWKEVLGTVAVRGFSKDELIEL